MYAFKTAEKAANRMISRGRRAIFCSEATANIKRFPDSSIFAMGMFTMRSLLQSLQRGLSPFRIHVAYIVMSGAVLKGPPNKILKIK